LIVIDLAINFIDEKREAPKNEEKMFNFTGFLNLLNSRIRSGLFQKVD